MLPIRDLLDRMRWDPQFKAAVFDIGYYDRVRDEIVRVPLDGLPEDLPLHRIRQVWRNGELIWDRIGRGGTEE